MTPFFQNTLLRVLNENILRFSKSLTVTNLLIRYSLFISEKVSFFIRRKKINQTYKMNAMNGVIYVANVTLRTL